MIGHYVKRCDGRKVRVGNAIVCDEVVCVQLNPFIVVSPGASCVWHNEFTYGEFVMGRRVPDGLWWACVLRALGTAGLLEPPLRWPRRWHGPELMLVHDYPACATYRGGRCTCDVSYE